MPRCCRELDALRWHDIDMERAEATLSRSEKRRPDVAYNHVPMWHKALRDAGVRNFRFHDLRHSCASYRTKADATLLEIAGVLGDRNLSITRRYSHLTTKNKADLVQRVLGDIK